VLNPGHAVNYAGASLSSALILAGTLLGAGIAFLINLSHWKSSVCSWLALFIMVGITIANINIKLNITIDYNS
jgi:hypothetical protein